MTNSTSDNTKRTDNAARRRVVRGQLRKLSTLGQALQDDHRWSPAWSSLALEEALQQILSAPDSDVNDVLHGLWDLLDVSNAPLNPVMVNFIRDVVVKCFTRYRTRYVNSNHDWMLGALKRQPTPAQAYLALVGLPEPQLAASQKDILAALTGSDFFADAQRTLSFIPSSQP